MKQDAPTAADLPPLWLPGPGHNGGPPLEPERRRPGRPSISTPALRDAVLDRLFDGVPMRAICREPGMPSRGTVQRWREADPAFDRMVRVCATEGYLHLAEKVVEEVERVLRAHGPRMARWVFNLRRQQLARQNPAFFGDRGMRC